MRSFRDFMESALYDPEQGFYPTREKTADFYTAAELHAAFGAVLADRLALLLERVAKIRPSQSLFLIEAGCGDGTLACQVARRLRVKHPALAGNLRFLLIERGRKDLTAAACRLTAFGLPVDAVTGIAKVPAFVGVLYSNELFDAMPVHLLESHGGEILEVFIDEAGRKVCGPLSRPELTKSAAALAGCLREGERHAVGLEAAAWLQTAARKLEAGFILSVDYGKRFAPSAANPPRAFRRHAIETELTREPGAQDLTASVDFEALIGAGSACDLSLESYESLSKFLLDGGIADWFAAACDDDSAPAAQPLGPASLQSAAYRERAKLKTLVHPEGMGEVFKVLIQGKGI